MIRVAGIIYRKAEERDLFPLMRLYQLSKHKVLSDDLFNDHERLLEAIHSENSSWIVGEKDGQILAAFSVLLDKENRLGKINRLYIDPTWQEWDRFLKDALPLLIQYLKDDKRKIEVVYTTTRTFSLEQQEMLLGMGFKILGILPVSQGVDVSRVNGVTAYFFDGVLTKKRHAQFSIHPTVLPFFKLAQEECGLPDVTVAKRPEMATLEFEKMPNIELIYAPDFVGNRFKRLNERKSLSVHFYPFTQPNALITDAEERIEIYVKLMPESRMATIIGERLDISINPTELYSRVSQMLNAQNITYIEVINDAADIWGVEAITAAGYLPCAYFPCLKSQGETRRDYVVLARSFERPFAETLVPFEIHHTFLNYFQEYYKLEAQNYLDKLKPH